MRFNVFTLHAVKRSATLSCVSETSNTNRFHSEVVQNVTFRFFYLEMELQISQSIKEPPLCEQGKYLNTDVMRVCADLEKTGYYSERMTNTDGTHTETKTNVLVFRW